MKTHNTPTGEISKMSKSKKPTMNQVKDAINYIIGVLSDQQTQLNQISDKLMSLSEKVGMQFIIQDFE